MWNGLERGGSEQLHSCLQCRKIWKAGAREANRYAGDSDNGKQELHQLIEQLPTEQVYGSAAIHALPLRRSSSACRF